MQRESAFNADMALVVIACDEGITPGTANVMQHALLQLSIATMWCKL